MSIAQVFDSLGYGVDVAFDDISYREKIQKELGLKFANLEIKNDFLKASNFLSRARITAKYKFVFYVTDGSYFFSLSPNNYIFAMVPEHNLYRNSIINRLKLFNWKFLSNSRFTKKWLSKWGIGSQVLYPFIRDDLFVKSGADREDIVLCVGRFFSHLHSKQQDKVIAAFIQLKRREPKFKNFKLILAGRLLPEDRAYFRKVFFAARGRDDIKILKNISSKELHDLYFKSRFLWQFTGLGKKIIQSPAEAEHLGIVPLEAQAAGCIPFCFEKGGAEETIEDGKNGFVFQDLGELYKKTLTVLDSKGREEQISKKARQYANAHFSYEVFKKQVIKTFNL